MVSTIALLSRVLAVPAAPMSLAVALGALAATSLVSVLALPGAAAGHARGVGDRATSVRTTGKQILLAWAWRGHGASDPLAWAMRAVARGEGARAERTLRSRVTAAANGTIDTAPAALARLRLALAYILSLEGHFVEATERYDDALRADPALFATCVELAGGCTRDGRDDAAEAALVAALALPVVAALDADVRARAHALYGRVLCGMGRLEESALQLRAAVGLCPEDADLREAYGAVLELLHRDEEALAHYRAGARRGPEHASLQTRLGALLLRLECFDEAATHLRMATALAPGEPIAHLRLAQLALLLGQWGEAERAATTALTAEPHAVEAHLALAAALFSLSDLPRAERHARRAAELAETYAPSFALLGTVARARGHRIESLLHLRQAVILDPTLPTTLRGEAERLEALQLDAAAQFRRQQATWIEQAVSEA